MMISMIWTFTFLPFHPCHYPNHLRSWFAFRRTSHKSPIPQISKPSSIPAQWETSFILALSNAWEFPHNHERTPYNSKQSLVTSSTLLINKQPSSSLRNTGMKRRSHSMWPLWEDMTSSWVFPGVNTTGYSSIGITKKLTNGHRSARAGAFPAMCLSYKYAHCVLMR